MPKMMLTSHRRGPSSHAPAIFDRKYVHRFGHAQNPSFPNGNDPAARDPGLKPEPALNASSILFDSPPQSAFRSKGKSFQSASNPTRKGSPHGFRPCMGNPSPAHIPTPKDTHRKGAEACPYGQETKSPGHVPGRGIA
jgi:hypothetical protein